MDDWGNWRLTTDLSCGSVVLLRLAIGAERIMADYRQIITAEI
jgi:hypothetical protein